MALPASIATSASSLSVRCMGIVDSIDLSQEDDAYLQELSHGLRTLSSTLSAMALFWTLNRLVTVSDELSDILRSLSVVFSYCGLTLERIQGSLKEGNQQNILNSSLWGKAIQSHNDVTALAMEAIIGDPYLPSVDISGVTQLLDNLGRNLEEYLTTAVPDDTLAAETKMTIENMQNLTNMVHHYVTITRITGGTISVSTAEDGPSAPNAAMALPAAPGSMAAEGQDKLSESEAFSKIRQFIEKKDFAAAEELGRSFLNQVALTLESRRLLAEHYYLGGMFEQMIEILQCPREALERDKFLGSNIKHLLAKAFFGMGEFDKALTYCRVGLEVRKDIMEYDQPVFMESVELLVAIFRATGRSEEVIAARSEYLSETHRQSFEFIDTLEDLFRGDKDLAAQSVIQTLDSSYGRENLMAKVQGVDCFLESIKEREFNDVILGIGNDASLLTISVDMDATGWVGPLGIRGLISRDRAPGSRCLAFDNLLRLAAKQGSTSELYTLRNFGADVEARYDALPWWPQLEDSHENMPPLCLAAEAGKSDVVALLLGGHADIERRGISQMTPLIFAARGGNVTTVETLLHRGAQIEAKDEYDRTALSHAAENGNIDVVEALLDWGADMETLDADGKKPLHYTVPFGHLPIFNLMMRVGAYRQTQLGQ